MLKNCGVTKSVSQMTLHPQAQALLEFMAQHPAPDPTKVPMPEVRVALLELSRYEIDAGLPIRARKTISPLQWELCAGQEGYPKLLECRTLSVLGRQGPCASDFITLLLDLQFNSLH